MPLQRQGVEVPFFRCGYQTSAKKYEGRLLYAVGGRVLATACAKTTRGVVKRGVVTTSDSHALLLPNSTDKDNFSMCMTYSPSNSSLSRCHLIVINTCNFA